MKFWNYIIIFTTLTLLFWIAGIDVVGITGLLTYVGFLNAEGIVQINSNNALRIVIFVLLAGATAVGIAISFLTKTKSENYIILPFIITGIVLFLNIPWSITTYAFSQAQWVGYITALIMIPLGVGFLIASYEHFRGTD